MEASCPSYRQEVHTGSTHPRAVLRDATRALSVQRVDASGSTWWSDSKCGHYVGGSCGVGKSYIACALAQDLAIPPGNRLGEILWDDFLARLEISMSKLLCERARVDPYSRIRVM